MKAALLNPNWRFDGSIYFGCTEPHLPLELGYTQALLQRAGHEAMLFDAALGDWSLDDLHAHLADFAPDCTVLATAPSYLFWRCPPPELRIPLQAVKALREVMGRLIVVGPHASTTPGATLRKLGADLAVLGECEEVVCQAVAADSFVHLQSVAYFDGGELVRHGPQAMADLNALPSLHWPDGLVRRHRHHHHRFGTDPDGYGAEVEASRGCPYSCSFCAKQDHRDLYRKRPLPVLLEEIDGLIGQGVTYLYFIDEIFLPDRALLEALRERPVRFGVQTRIDLWKPELLDLLGEAGCVSIEAGVESITHEGRERLDKRCRLSTAQLGERLLRARRGVPFVQASLLDAGSDRREEVAAWREEMIARGVWVNVPVPMFPYPGSLDYARRWGPPDDRAWERAVEYYRGEFAAFSDIQVQRPLPVDVLEAVS
jgi:B12-binding domain/radical SAM domain protein of rhizo-twelve system